MKRKQEKPSGETNEPALNRFQKFEIVRVHRSQLKGAKYNPRTMDPDERARLRRGLKQHGLVEPLIWNVQTGTLVGGHQRLRELDALEGKADYLLDVAQIDVDERQEKAINVALNNPNLQGRYDLPLLEKLFSEDKIDFESAGFSSADLYRMFGSNPLVAQPEKLVEMGNQLREAQERFENIKEAHVERDNDDYYLVVATDGQHPEYLIVFKDHAERQAFTSRFGLSDNRYIDRNQLEAHWQGKSPYDYGEEDPLECPDSVRDYEPNELTIADGHRAK